MGKRAAAGVGVVVLGAALIVAGTGGARAETLKGAMQKAIRHHPKAKRAEWNSAAAFQEAEAQRGQLFPQFGLEGYFGPEYRDRSIVGVSTDSFESSREGRFVVRQLLYDGLLTPKETKAAFKRADASKALEDDVKEELALSVAEAYLGVLRSREQVGLAMQNVGVHEESLGRITERFEAGRGQKADVALVEGRLGLAQSSVDTRRTILENHNVRYRQLVGEEPRLLKLPNPVNGSSLPDSIAEADTTGNFARIASELAFESARLVDEAGKGLRWPRLDLEVSGSAGEDVGGIAGADNQFSLFLVGRWDLYTGGTLVAQQRQRLARANEAASLASDTVRLVDEDMGQAIADHDGAISREGALTDYALSMREVVDAYEQQFELGTRAILDVLNVRNEEFRAKSALVDASYEKLLAEYRMLSAMGRLVSTVVGDYEGKDMVAAPGRITEISAVQAVDGVEVIEVIDDGNYERRGLFGLIRKRGNVDETGNTVLRTTSGEPPDEFGGNKVIYAEWDETDTGGNKVEPAPTQEPFGSQSRKKGYKR